MTQIPFYKMHGAANDFIVVDDRELRFPLADKNWMASIMARNTGIGSEGILLIQPSNQADFRMRFINPDGGEVDMCGNGARCIARLARELEIAPQQMKFDTMAGEVGATVNGDTVHLTMTSPKDWRLGCSLPLDSGTVPYDFVNSGVPHVVVTVEDVAQIDVQELGAAIRHHADFAPHGTNVNFIAVTGPQRIQLRTYERGVEAETPACGTGIVAAALIAGRTGRCAPPIQVISAGGYVLEVNFKLTDHGADDVTLTGPAEHVFRGVLEYTGAAD